MRALVFDEFGPADVLHLADAEKPQPEPGQVRIAVRAASVNPVDWKIRSGASRAFHSVVFPAIPGIDAAGVVDLVGEGVMNLQAGDEVFGTAIGGAAAEFALLQPTAVKPATMDWATAAALPSVVETGLRALEMIGLVEGDILVINGVAGGVGLATAQFAIDRGARVIGTASEPRHSFLSEIGIEPVAYGDGLLDRIRAVADHVDRVIDVAGNGILADLLELVGGDTERVLTVADATAGEHGVFFTTGAEGRYWQALERAADLWSQGRFRMPVSATFPLADGAAAHRASEAGHVLGKIVISLP